MAVLVNGRPVDALDVAGNFFVSVPIAAGLNTFELEAIDQFGQSGTTTVTLNGVTADALAAAAITEDVTLGADLQYARTTFNRSTNMLHADVRLHNPTVGAAGGADPGGLQPVPATVGRAGESRWHASDRRAVRCVRRRVAVERAGSWCDVWSNRSRIWQSAA